MRIADAVSVFVSEICVFAPTTTLVPFTVSDEPRTAVIGPLVKPKSADGVKRCVRGVPAGGLRVPGRLPKPKPDPQLPPTAGTREMRNAARDEPLFVPIAVAQSPFLSAKRCTATCSLIVVVAATETFDLPVGLSVVLTTNDLAETEVTGPEMLPETVPADAAAAASAATRPTAKVAPATCRTISPRSRNRLRRRPCRRRRRGGAGSRRSRRSRRRR